MKKKLFTLAAALLFAAKAQAQVAVVMAPVLEGIMQATHAEQMIYYAQSLYQTGESAVNTYNQFQNMLRMEKLALDNLKSAANITSFDGFMDWYNRQLYLERQAERSFNRMGVKIGGTSYKLKDIDDIPSGLESYDIADQWAAGLSEAQRRQMWLNLGMTPANYAYVQTWEEKEKQLALTLLTKPETINEDNKIAFERMKEISDILMNDKNKSDDAKLTEKSLLQLLIELQMDSNRAIREGNMDAAQANEYLVSRDKQENAPPNTPDLSEMWNQELFGSISAE